MVLNDGEREVNTLVTATKRCIHLAWRFSRDACFFLSTVCLGSDQDFLSAFPFLGSWTCSRLILSWWQTVIRRT